MSVRIVDGQVEDCPQHALLVGADAGRHEQVNDEADSLPEVVPGIAEGELLAPEQDGADLPCDVAEDDPDSHSCDHMGCGSVGPHIVGRFALPKPMEVR